MLICHYPILAYQTEYLAPVDIKAHIIHGLDRFIALLKPGAQLSYGNQRVLVISDDGAFCPWGIDANNLRV